MGVAGRPGAGVRPAAITEPRSATGYSQSYYDIGLSAFPVPYPGNRAPLDAAIAVRSDADDIGFQMLTAMNDQWQVRNLDDSGLVATSQTSPQPLRQFGVAVGLPTNFLHGDVVARYDVVAGRYIMTMHAFVNPNVVTNPGVNILAVSKTNDAAGEWWVYRLAGSMTGDMSCPAGQYPLPDYPQTSYDANGIYIGYLLFCNGVYTSSAILAIPKAAAYAGTLTNYAVYTSASMVAALPPNQVTAINPAVGAAVQPQPAAPQAAADVTNTAYFVMQVGEVAWVDGQ
jgi:hypothetical protein